MRLLPNAAGFLPGTFFADDVAKAEKLWCRVLEIIDSDSAAPKYSAVDPTETANQDL